MKRSRDVSKNEFKIEVGYEDPDPYIYASENAGIFKRSRRQVTKRVSFLAFDDPFVTMTSKSESAEGGKENGQNSATDAFNGTLPLNDKMSSQSILFDMRKPRIKWKLIPFISEGVKLSHFPSTANAIDRRRLEYRSIPCPPFPKVGIENVDGLQMHCHAVSYSCSDKRPIRCMTERSSSMMRTRVLFRRNRCRLKYKPSVVNAKIQQEWNKRENYQPMELKLMRQHVIPQWASANPSRFLYPFAKTDGMYWPIVQPHDAIDLNDEDQVTSADTRNQLVCLSELTFASKRQLLCGQDDQFHLKRYLSASEADTWEPGRFRNRIGYMRVFSSQTIEDARVKDENRQRKEATWIAGVVAAGSLETCKSAYELDSSVMAKHVDFNLSDMFSKKRERNVPGSRIPSHISKGTRGSLQVPREWLEVDIAHYVPTSERRNHLCSYTNYRNRLAKLYQPRNKGTFSCEVVQYHVSAIKAIFIHQSGFSGMVMRSPLSDDDHRKSANRVDEIESELNRGRTSMGKLKTLCELQDWEEKYWTIIWDNLSSIFRSAPPISQLKIDQFISKAFGSAAKIKQRGAYYNRFRGIVDRAGSR